MPRTFAISELIETEKVGALSKRVVALCGLMMITDGYDTAALSYAVPSLIRLWHVDKVSMGAVFSLQLFGLMIGSMAFGYFGDRFGRKSVIIAGTFLFGAASLLTALAGDINQLYVVRFLFGLGVGGALPNAVAMCNEYAPRRFRISVIALIFVGYTLGSSGGGLFSAWLMPQYGWQIVFQIGGWLPILVCFALYAYMPESIRYLALKHGSSPRTLQVARTMRPDLAIDDGVTILPDRESGAKTTFSPLELLKGPRKFMTPFLWLLYIANSMATFALTSWMPTLMETAGLPPATSAVASSFLSIGGAAGGLLAARGIDRFGLLSFVFLPALAVPVIGGMGYATSLGEYALFFCIAIGGFCVLGAQNCLHGLAGSIYPTSIRANGVGWALGVAKIGSMSGPILAGILLAAGLSVRGLFMAVAIPLFVGLLSAIALMALYNTHIHRTRDVAVAAE
jgi:AAHS family 4-hydroxybenzoate transporter-like MFS transporter